MRGLNRYLLYWLTFCALNSNLLRTVLILLSLLLYLLLRYPLLHLLRSPLLLILLLILTHLTATTILLVAASLMRWLLLLHNLFGLLLVLFHYQLLAGLADVLCLAISRDGLLSEGEDSVQVFLDKRRELVREVDEVVRVHISTRVVLTVAHDVVTSQKLLIKEDDNSVVGMSDDGAAKSKRNVFSSCRIDVDHTISHFVIIYTLM